MAKGINSISIRQYQEAARFILEALMIQKSLYGEDPHPEIARSLHNVANIHTKLKKFHLAKLYAQQALEMATALYDEGHPQITRELELLANIDKEYQRQAAEREDRIAQGQRPIANTNPEGGIATLESEAQELREKLEERKQHTKLVENDIYRAALEKALEQLQFDLERERYHLSHHLVGSSSTGSIAARLSTNPLAIMPPPPASGPSEASGSGIHQQHR